MPSLALDWLHVIILLSAIQGVFLTVALATKRRNRVVVLRQSRCRLALNERFKQPWPIEPLRSAFS